MLEAFPKINRAVLFGSRAIGTFRGASDLDLALEGDDLKLSDLVTVRSRIGRLELPFEADVVIRAKITNPDVEKHIRDYGRVFYQRKMADADMSGWREMTLREAGVSLIDCDHRTPPPSENGYPYVAIPQLKQGRLDLSDARRITREHFVEWTRKANPQPNDVVLSRRCNPGESAFVPKGLEFALGQNLVLLRADESKMFPPFLRWLVRGEKWWEQIDKFINVGAIFNSLRCADIPSFELPIPPVSEQRAIASVLGSLDDKIELNQRMNETLEAVAQSLFKSWFVDATQSALPKGWREGVVEDLGDIICGKTPPTSDPTNYGTDIPFVTIPDMHGQMFVTRTGKSLSQQGADTQPTKTLPPYSICVSCIATPGLVILTSQPCQTNQQINSVVPNTGYSPFYCYFALRELSEEICSRGSGGSVTANLNKGDFAKIPIGLPPVELSKQFQELTEPVFKRILSNEHESRTLAALRDALLPKLLSGELRVPQKLEVA